MYINTRVRTDFTSYLNEHNQKELLRFITCGSVDDGKSTLIGRILYESELIHDDQLYALTTNNKKFGSSNDEPDLALLVDGLLAEREQGITIDVAYRFFSTDKRKFIVADTPGHEQYTRNMATGASTADAAVVLVDACKGIVTQTRRHSYIVAMLGVKHIILAINKMDLVNYDERVFEKIKTDFHLLCQSLGIQSPQAIPVSALKGTNIINPSAETPWYPGPTLMHYLEEILPGRSLAEELPFRMAVQWINRGPQNFRGFSGRISSGRIKPGDSIRIVPGNQHTSIASIVSYDGDWDEAKAGQSVTFTIKDELDISRGDLFSSVDNPCEASDKFSSRLLWMSDIPLVSGRQYLFKSHTASALCTPGKPKYRLDITTMEQLAADELRLNEIGDCDIFLDRSIAFEPYNKNRELGGFILIDRLTHATVAAGFIHSALRPFPEATEQMLSVNSALRAAIKGQKPVVLWFTGLSGAGKSTIANLVERELNSLGKHSMLLDGDHIRHSLNRDLDFTASGRAENIRRIAEVAKLMLDAGLITLVSFISPFQAERDMARQRIGSEQFLEIYVDAPLAIAEERDVKGLYKKARTGAIENFTGISSPYEIPANPDLHLDTSVMSALKSAELVMALLREKQFLSPFAQM
jgi:bifunctional enzyme CysN/CysC